MGCLSYAVAIVLLFPVLLATLAIAFALSVVMYSMWQK